MTYIWGWFVFQDLLNLVQNFGSEFGYDFQCLQIVENLLWLAGTENDSAGIWIPRHPGQSEMSYIATKFCRRFTFY